MKYTFALLAFAFSVAIRASAATDYYISTPFTGTTAQSGCSTSTARIRAGSVTEIPDEISSFTFGGTNPVSATTTSSGKVTLQNFVISKAFDDCSAPLITAFLTSEQMPTVTIYAVKTVGAGVTSATPYLTITLKNVIISQYTLTGSDEKPSEQISLTFSTASVTAPKASGSGTTTLNYDGSLNQLTR